MFLWVMLTVLLSGDAVLRDGDTYMHIAIGDWIIAHGEVPLVDYFSHTKFGQPWVAHEWLAEVVLAMLYRYTGWSGLVLVAALCSAFSVAYILRFSLGRKVVPVYAIAFAVMTFMVLKTHLLARPHILTWPIIVIWMAGLLRASEAGRAPSRWLLLLLPLWVNLHGGFVLAFALLGLVALDALSSVASENRYKLLRDWSVFALLGLVATLINPFGYKAYLFLVDLMGNVYLKYINEWQPIDFDKHWFIQVWLYGLLSLGLLGMLRLPLWRLVLLLCLLYQTLSHVRYMSILGLLLPMLIAAPFAASYKVWAKSIQRSEQTENAVDRFFNRLSVPVPWLSWLMVLSVGVGVAFLNAKQSANRPASRLMPQAAVDAALGAGLTGRVFNHDGGGGYLIMRGIPVYTDGRADLYGPEFMLNTSRLLYSEDPQYIQQQLDLLEIGWVLLPQPSTMLKALMGSPSWDIVHNEGGAVVLGRKK